MTDQNQDQKPSSSGIGVAISLLLAVVVVGAIAYLNRPSAPVPEQQSDEGQVAGEVAASAEVSVESDDPALGNADAPLVVVEFSDFECPFCKQFHEATFVQVRQEYIDSGKIRFVFKHFPLSQIHSHAQQAAQAAHCAHQQQQFWAYADLLFSNQQALEEEHLVAYAGQLGLDEQEFQQCIGSNQTQESVATDQRAGIDAGVTATPTFVIGGRVVEGALPAGDFRALVESALAQQSQ